MGLLKRTFPIILIAGLFACSKKVETALDSGPAKELMKHRERYKTEFLHDQRAPLKTESEVALMDFFDYNAALDVPCTFEKNNQPEVFEMPTYSGTTRSYIVYGTATCPINGKPITVNLYKTSKAFQNPIYQNLLFFPFKDATNTITTYGGGRYIDLNVNDIMDNKINIDFNKCYNPWCAYSDGYNCPIPPKENHLSIAIEAGEKNYKGEVKKSK